MYTTVDCILPSSLFPSRPPLSLSQSSLLASDLLILKVGFCLIMNCYNVSANMY